MNKHGQLSSYFELINEIIELFLGCERKKHKNPVEEQLTFVENKTSVKQKFRRDAKTI